MPWRSTRELPKAVRDNLPEAARRIWMAAANAALEDGATDERAARIAWAAVKRKYRKDADGAWIRIDKAEFDGEIVGKIDDERLVFLWMSVAKKDGETVVDKQGDLIDEADLERAVYEFMAGERVAKAMHKGERVGTHVAGLVLTTHLQKFLGIDAVMDRVGWLSVVKVEDDEVWARVKKGEYAMGSIGGTGVREEVDG